MLTQTTSRVRTTCPTARNSFKDRHLLVREHLTRATLLTLTSERLTRLLATFPAVATAKPKLRASQQTSLSHHTNAAFRDCRKRITTCMWLFIIQNVTRNNIHENHQRNIQNLLSSGLKIKMYNSLLCLTLTYLPYLLNICTTRKEEMSNVTGVLGRLVYSKEREVAMDKACSQL